MIVHFTPYSFFNAYILIIVNDFQTPVEFVFTFLFYICESESVCCSVVSDSLGPHGLQLHGKNTGVGNHSFLHGFFPTKGLKPGMKILFRLSHQGSQSILLCACQVASIFSCVRIFVILWTVDRQTSLPWDSPGKNTGVGCHALLQEIFLTQGSNPSLLCLIGRPVLYHQHLFCLHPVFKYQGTHQVLNLSIGFVVYSYHLYSNIWEHKNYLNFCCFW